MNSEKVITEAGKKALSVMLQEVMRQEGLTSQETFADWITIKSGVKVTENRVYRLLKCRYDDATLSTLIPIIRADILQLPNGDSYTFNDLVDLLCGVLDPETGERRCYCSVNPLDGE